MIYSLICLLTGIYIGQEYQLIIPNVRVLGISILAFIREKYNEEQNKQKGDITNESKESFFNWFR